MAPVFEIGGRKPQIEMQFARAAVVVEPIGDIGMLLHFAQSQACANGVNRSGGNEECVAGFDVDPAQQVFNLTAQRRLAQPVPRNGLPKSESEPRARIGPQNIPHLGFPERPFVFSGELVARALGHLLPERKEEVVASTEKAERVASQD